MVSHLLGKQTHGEHPCAGSSPVPTAIGELAECVIAPVSKTGVSR